MVLDSSSVNRDEPSHRVPLHSRVTVTEFSPFQWSAGLLALGFQSSFSLVQVTFPEEETDGRTQLEFSTLKEIHHDTRVQALAWSPKSSVIVAPKCLEVATSGTDHKLRIFSSDCGNELNVKTLEGHTDYINSIVYEPELGGQVVSGSDDHTVIMWAVASGRELSRLHFKSPVMSVCWHATDLGKLCVGQKAGTVSLFNSSSLQPILSVDCGLAPLLSCDWSQANSLLLAAGVSSELVVFDLSRPSLPSLRKPDHSEGVRHVRCSRLNDALVASCGRPGNSLSVSHSKSHQVLLASSAKVAQGGISWHARLPYLGVGGDRELTFFKVVY